MSFAIWSKPPPFRFDKDSAEQIYQVGSVWVVTDDPTRATQSDVDAALNPPVVVRTVAEKLAPLGLTVADLKAELSK